MQITHAIPKNWKDIIKDDNGNSKNLVFYDNHLSKGGLIYGLNKLNSKELYQLQINFNPATPIAQEYFNKQFDQSNLDWKQIYLLGRKTTINTSLRMFQYKMLNNILFLNKKLFIFGLVDNSKCSFCKLNDETVIHLCTNCTIINNLWKELKRYFSPVFNMPDITPQSAIFGFIDNNYENLLLINHTTTNFQVVHFQRKEKGTS